MKKIIMGLLLLSSMIIFGENSSALVDSHYEINEKTILEEIKILDKKLEYDTDKENLNKNYEKNSELLKQYFEIIQYDAEKIFQLGDYYFKDNRYDKALEIFSKDTSNFKNLYGAAVCSRFLNQNNQAIKYYTKAIELEPNFSELYLGRGLSYRNIGYYSKAIQDLKKFVSDTNSQEGYIALGDTYLAMKDYKEAQVLLKVAKQMYPNSKIIIEMSLEANSKV